MEAASEVHPATGARFSMALVSRRSRRHPGTRYIARGLNERAGPGNEIESELLVWTHPAEGGGGAAGGSEPLRWARVVWRRGTVPIWWGVQLQSLQKGLQAEVFVRSEQPYRGTISYFRSIQRQHVPRPALGQPAAGAGAGSQQQQAGVAASSSGSSRDDPSLQVPITCVNLLHCNPKKAAELMLSSHFQEARRRRCPCCLRRSTAARLLSLGARAAALHLLYCSLF